MKKKKSFDSWRWQSIDAEVVYNLPWKVVMYLAGPITPKKNQKRAFRWIVLPSANYVERHKRILDKLWNIEWKFNSFPCAIEITSIVWDRVKSDCDNQVSSILDTLVDLWVIEDDNRFIVKDIHVRNVWYAKNCWLTRIEIKPYTLTNYDLLDEHKDTNLLDYKHYLEEYALRI